jgi:RimJ/RimL family protein N-acetyltransferase
MDRWLKPTNLTGQHVRLEPLAPEHEAGLTVAAADGELWRLWFTTVPPPGQSGKYIATALDMQERQGALPFVIRRTANDEIIGSTRYFNVDASNRRLEIGHTWYAKSAQRSACNTEAKLLLLGYAFESLDCIAVEFRTHWMNHASRAAIARLGAKQDGVLRNHQIGIDGTLRDTVVFSIIAPEWPTVRYALKNRLERAAC